MKLSEELEQLKNIAFDNCDLGYYNCLDGIDEQARELEASKEKYIDLHDSAKGRLNKANEYIDKLEARVKELENREANCKTMDYAEKIALVRGFQNLCNVLGVSADEYSMPELIEMVRLLKGGE